MRSLNCTITGSPQKRSLWLNCMARIRVLPRAVGTRWQLRLLSEGITGTSMQSQRTNEHQLSMEESWNISRRKGECAYGCRNSKIHDFWLCHLMCTTLLWRVHCHRPASSAQRAMVEV